MKKVVVRIVLRCGQVFNTVLPEAEGLKFAEDWSENRIVKGGKFRSSTSCGMKEFDCRCFVIDVDSIEAVFVNDFEAGLLSPQQQGSPIQAPGLGVRPSPGASGYN